MRKIKIGHVVGGLMFGGVETYLINYIDFMNSEKFEIHIYSYTKPILECSKRFEDAGCIIHEVGSMNSNPIKSFFDLISQIKRDKLDILECHMTFTNFHGLAAGFFSGVRNRLSHAHLFNVREGNRLKQFIRNNVYASLSKFFATEYIAASKAAATDLFGKKNVREGKVKIFKNAISQKRFQFNKTDRNELRRKYKIEKNDIVIGNIGRFVLQKNHDFIIDVFEELQKGNNGNYVLMLLGIGELKESLQEKIRMLNLDEKVIFVKPNQEIQKYYSCFDLFLFPSLYEGMPLVTTEAQANGLAILASKGPIPDESKISKAYNELPLDLGKVKWAEYIRKMNFSRIPIENNLKNSGLEITFEAGKLINYYENLVKKG
ncbi:glycosyltransferase [Enterococcus sp. DIV0756]|uniref:glycosyltransferase n=1 Tax=Enterococcus sp. DIV0756 TaxID=2774636 RepID=UPI003F2855CF